VATLTIAGLAPPGQAADAAVTPASFNEPVSETTTAPKKPSFKGAAQEKLRPAAVKPVEGSVKLAVSLKVPRGWKMNPDAPMSYWLDSPKPDGPVDRTAFGRTRLATPAADFEVLVPVTGAGDDEVAVSLNYYYCEAKPEGVCKVGSVVFSVPLKIDSAAKAGPVKLVHTIRD
jgi:hypothetical protein